MDEQAPLPPGLDGSGSILQYVEFMTMQLRQEEQEEQEEEEEVLEDGEEDASHGGGGRVAAYIKGGVSGWQGGQTEPASNEAIERTLQL